jgi:hypothetical protein
MDDQITIVVEGPDGDMEKTVSSGEAPALEARLKAGGYKFSRKSELGEVLNSAMETIAAPIYGFGSGFIPGGHAPVTALTKAIAGDEAAAQGEKNVAIAKGKHPYLYGAGYAAGLLNPANALTKLGGAAANLVPKIAANAPMLAKMGVGAVKGAIGGGTMGGVGTASEELAGASDPYTGYMDEEPSAAGNILNSTIFGAGIGAPTGGIGVPLAEKFSKKLRTNPDFGETLVKQEEFNKGPITEFTRGIKAPPRVAENIANAPSSGLSATDLAIKKATPALEEGSVGPAMEAKKVFTQAQQKYYKSPEGMAQVPLDNTRREVENIIKDATSSSDNELLAIVNTDKFQKILERLSPTMSKEQLGKAPTIVAGAKDASRGARTVNARELDEMRAEIDAMINYEAKNMSKPAVERLERIGKGLRKDRDNFAGNADTGGKSYSEFNADQSARIQGHKDMLEKAGVSNIDPEKGLGPAERQSLVTSAQGYRQGDARFYQDEALRDIIQAGGGDADQLLEIAATKTFPGLQTYTKPWGIRANLSDPLKSGPTGMNPSFFTLRADPVARAIASDPSTVKPFPINPFYPAMSMKDGIMGGRAATIKGTKKEKEKR